MTQPKNFLVDTAPTIGAVSSTGGIGIQDDPVNHRVRSNGEYAASIDDLSNQFVEVITYPSEEPRTRHLLRCIASGATMAALRSEESGSALNQYLEVALPLAEYGHESDWLVYLAYNSDSRQSSRNSQEIKDLTAPDKYRASTKSTLERIEQGVYKGKEIHGSIKPGHEKQLVNLWGPAFGWKPEGVIELRDRLLEQQRRPGEKRDLWFASVIDGGRLASAAMVETLGIPGRNGLVTLMETTEWASLPDEGFRGRGNMGIVVAALHAQVHRDTASQHGIEPILYGEFNIADVEGGFRADQVAAGLGLVKPENDIALHTARQNVYVCGELEDFTFMRVPNLDNARRNEAEAALKHIDA